MKIWMLAFVSLIGLTGCATTPPPEAKPVPADRVYYKTQAEATNSATIVVVRDSGVRGAGTKHNFSINGVKAASLGTGEKFTLPLPAGEYVLGVQLVDVLGMSGMAEYSIDQRLEAGKTYFYRILLEFGNDGRIQRVIN